MSEAERSEEVRRLLSGDMPDVVKRKKFWGRLPSEPRCKLCNAPFSGVGGLITRFRGLEPWPKNPAFCDECFPKEPGGAETEASMLFADIRGSTSIAERMAPSDYTKMINRFYAKAAKALHEGGAFLDRLVGDEVIGFFFPGFAGPEHARVAVHAAEQILRTMPDIPIGIGIHTGLIWYGAVGEADDLTDVTGLGDNVNVAARLSSLAEAGEILVSEEAYEHAHLHWANLESRQLQVKGRGEPVSVRVLRVTQKPKS